MAASGSFKGLRVWQAAMKLAREVYRETAKFPKHELYGLTQQIRRAAVSVPSNVARAKGVIQTRNSRTSCVMLEVRYWNWKLNLY
jgi:four helix bundle protein